MSLNVLIFILRIAGAALLYLFMTVAVLVVWRDGRIAARQVAQQREAEAKPLGRLVVVEAGKTGWTHGEAFTLAAATRLGRAPANTVIVEDAFASSEHALLAFRSGRWWLQDLGSRNGTLLNEERLNTTAIVSTGDVIGIGEVRLRIELG
ncbi:MAG: FHA domain-containing protein [Anaerolineae bacterium]|nr:FHA domain-containing protein [Anaerolineae bacterium]